MKTEKWNIKTRDVNKIKFNAVDFDEKDYIEYNVWLTDVGYEHNLESMSEFLNEHFGCNLVQFTGFSDVNNEEIFELNKVKVIINNKESVAMVVFLNSDIALKFTSGDLLSYDVLPLSYVVDTAKATIEIIDKFDFENIKE